NNGELDFGTTAAAQAGNPTITPFPANGSLTPVEGIVTLAGVGNLNLVAVDIGVGNNLTINANPTGNQLNGGFIVSAAQAVANSTGNLQVNLNQSVGNLTFRSGLNEAQVNSPAALMVTGTVSSGGVVLSPTANLPGGIPTVSNFSPSAFHGTGSLILAPASGT